jgi:hypothetical protein
MALAVADKSSSAEEGEEDSEEEDVSEGEECEILPWSFGKCDDEEEVDESIYESYANSADNTFEADIDFMTKVISGGLNKQKSTGQTTNPLLQVKRIAWVLMD